MRPSRWTLVESIQWLGVVMFLAQLGIPAYLTANRISERSGGAIGWAGWAGLFVAALALGLAFVAVALAASVAPMWLVMTIVGRVRRARRRRAGPRRPCPPAG